MLLDRSAGPAPEPGTVTRTKEGACPFSSGGGHRGAAAAKIGAKSIQNWELPREDESQVEDGRVSLGKIVWGLPFRCSYSNKSPKNPKIARTARARWRPERDPGADKAVGSWIAISEAFDNIAELLLFHFKES